MSGIKLLVFQAQWIEPTKGKTDKSKTLKSKNADATLATLDVVLLIEDEDVGLPLAPKIKALQARIFPLQLQRNNKLCHLSLDGELHLSIQRCAEKPLYCYQLIE
jgi:hypothetical protein